MVWHGDDTVLNRRARSTIGEAEHVLLLTGPDGRYEEEALPAYGLGPPTLCAPVVSRLDTGIRLCVLDPGVDR